MGGSCVWVDRPVEYRKTGARERAPHTAAIEGQAMPLRSVAACQSRVVDVQRLAETRALPEHPQRKKGGRSVFGKWTTRKRGNLIFLRLRSAWKSRGLEKVVAQRGTAIDPLQPFEMSAKPGAIQGEHGHVQLLPAPQCSDHEIN